MELAHNESNIINMPVPQIDYMDRMPYEVVLKISGYLSPQDLAHCSAVRRNWREMFNDDRYWRPHCDPELAEHLRNTPSVVEPAFVSPEKSNMLLNPIGHWKLAFLREEHLWKNLKQDNYKKEEFGKIKNEIQRDFLTNALVVRWCSDRIEIWDVSVTPIVFVAKTYPSVDLGGSVYHCVVSSSVLLVEQTAQIKVFDVDALNKLVVLRHDIPLNEASHCRLADLTRVEKENIYVRVKPNRLGFEIFDIEAGQLKRNEPCPAMGNGNGDARIVRIVSSPTSNIVIVGVGVPSSPSCFRCHCYNSRELAFLQSPEVSDCVDVAVHAHYLAVLVDGRTVKVYNCHTLELIYDKTYVADVLKAPLHVFNNCFIFTLINHKLQPRLDVFSPTDREVTTVCIQDEEGGTICLQDEDGGISLETINDNILYACDDLTRTVVGVWKASGGTLKPYDFIVRHGLVFNKVLTRGMLKTFHEELMFIIYHYW